MVTQCRRFKCGAEGSAHGTRRRQGLPSPALQPLPLCAARSSQILGFTPSARAQPPSPGRNPSRCPSRISPGTAAGRVLLSCQISSCCEQLPIPAITTSPGDSARHRNQAAAPVPVQILPRVFSPSAFPASHSPSSPRQPCQTTRPFRHTHTSSLFFFNQQPLPLNPLSA